jgi:hypothetical protein
VQIDTKIGTFLLKGGIFGYDGTTANSNGQAGSVGLKDPQSVTVLGGIHAGRTATGIELAYNGALFIAGNAKTVTIKGGISGNSEKNAFLLAGGTAPTEAGDFVAIGKLSIVGDVSYATIASGHGFSLTTAVGDAENPDAGIGKVTVSGNWIHSNLLVGVNDVGTFGASVDDTHSVGDAARVARLAALTIRGRILDDPTVSGRSGFEAEKIGSITAAGARLFTSGDAARFLDFSQFVYVREV